MYCPSCNKSFSPVHSRCPDCKGWLKVSAPEGAIKAPASTPVLAPETARPVAVAAAPAPRLAVPGPSGLTPSQALAARTAAAIAAPVNGSGPSVRSQPEAAPSGALEPAAVQATVAGSGPLSQQAVASPSGMFSSAPAEPMASSAWSQPGPMAPASAPPAASSKAGLDPEWWGGGAASSFPAASAAPASSMPPAPSFQAPPLTGGGWSTPASSTPGWSGSSQSPLSAPSGSAVGTPGAAAGSPGGSGGWLSDGPAKAPEPAKATAWSGGAASAPGAAAGSPGGSGGWLSDGPSAPSSATTENSASTGWGGAPTAQTPSAASLPALELPDSETVAVDAQGQSWEEVPASGSSRLSKYLLGGLAVTVVGFVAWGVLHRHPAAGPLEPSPTSVANKGPDPVGEELLRDLHKNLAKKDFRTAVRYANDAQTFFDGKSGTPPKKRAELAKWRTQANLGLAQQLLTDAHTAVKRKDWSQAIPRADEAEQIFKQFKDKAKESEAHAVVVAAHSHLTDIHGEGLPKPAEAPAEPVAPPEVDNPGDNVPTGHNTGSHGPAPAAPSVVSGDPAPKPKNRPQPVPYQGRRQDSGERPGDQGVLKSYNH